MAQDWLAQLRVTLPDALAGLARTNPGAPALHPLVDILARHDAVMVSQLDAFEAYVAEAERAGSDTYPLYRWTVATLADPALRARHGRTFALRVGGCEVYAAAVADALEAALRPLEGGGVVVRLSRHDTNPANNLAVPEQYRG